MESLRSWLLTSVSNIRDDEPWYQKTPVKLETEYDKPDEEDESQSEISSGSETAISVSKLAQYQLTSPESVKLEDALFMIDRIGWSKTEQIVRWLSEQCFSLPTAQRTRLKRPQKQRTIRKQLVFRH